MGSYDKNSSGEISKNEIATMMIDAYKSMSKGFNPSTADVDTFFKVLDKDGDGKIST
jgi:Ca2+-binding EF-hand superfamily protein